MKFPTQPGRFLIIAALAAVACPLGARADINGFGDFSGFTINQSDSSAAPTVAPGVIHLTNAANFEARSIFDNTKQNISQFSASYTFQAKGPPTDGNSFGATMVFQNSGAGLHTVAAYNISGIVTKFGYSDFGDSFNKSAAVSLEYSTLTSGSSSTGYYTNGSVGSGSSTTSPVNIFSGDPINASLVYNGTTIQETLQDTITLATFSTSFLANIPSAVQGSTAFVGFTADTNGSQDAVDISNFQFTAGAVPEPASLGILGAFGAGLLRRRRR